MSGLEIAGVVLGAFPLIVFGVEQYRKLAANYAFFLAIQEEYEACLGDMEYYHLMYQQNLRILLMPVTADASELSSLMRDPLGPRWKEHSFQQRLESRLGKSFKAYIGTLKDMRDTMEKLKRELMVEDTALQARIHRTDSTQQTGTSGIPCRSKPAKTKAFVERMEFEAYRLKFSINNATRKPLFDRLKETNERLEKLLSIIAHIHTLSHGELVERGSTYALEKTCQKIWKRSDRLFQALRASWQCSCTAQHFANLRLEHHMMDDACFEVILTFASQLSLFKRTWSWKELRCYHPESCPVRTSSPPPDMELTGQTVQLAVEVQPSHTIPGLGATSGERQRRVNFAPLQDDTTDQVTWAHMKLCENLGSRGEKDYVGMIQHDNEMFHLHSISKRKHRIQDRPITLDEILNSALPHKLSRRQRISVALLLASSVAQLQFGSWLDHGLTKYDVLFFPSESGALHGADHEPFICQGFPKRDPTRQEKVLTEYDFLSLGILLLELCFGKRLEDSIFRTKQVNETNEVKKALDMLAAHTWAKEVFDEMGTEYNNAVKWCLGANGARNRNRSHSWRGQYIKNVIRPLEECQNHFREAQQVA